MPVIVGKLIREIRSLNVLGRIPPYEESIPHLAADIEKGDTEYVDCGSDSSLEIGGDFAVGCWIKPESYLDSDEFTIVSKHDRGDAADRSWKLLIANDLETYGKIIFVTYTAAGAVQTVVKVTLSETLVGSWWHLFVTRDSSTGDVIVYLNAVEQAQSTTIEASGVMGVSSGIEVTIGAALNSGAGERYYDGLIQNVRLYDAYFDDSDDVEAEMESIRSEHANIVEEWALDGDFEAEQNPSVNEGVEVGGTIPFVTGKSYSS